MTFSYIFDGLIVLLLGVAIGYAYVLNQRLRLLRDSRGELETVVGALTEAIGQADAGLSEIHSVADSLGRDLDRKIDSARGHAGDIETLIERAEAAAGRLETAIGLSREAEAGGPTPRRDDPVERRPLRERPAKATPKPKARPTPAKLFVGPAEEEELLARAGSGSIVKALRGMR